MEILSLDQYIGIHLLIYLIATWSIVELYCKIIQSFLS